MTGSKNENADCDERANYWNSFYAGSQSPSIPSQFAVFVLNEKPNGNTIVDIGCGTGRDSLFFSTQGLFCVGVDGSELAIEHCNKTINVSGSLNSEFIRGNLRDTRLPSDINRVLENRQLQGPFIVYARFLVHAITDEEEVFLFDVVNEILVGREGCVALEFRTDRDKSQPKEFDTHFRRYVNPVHFFARAHKNGFEVEYFVEGFGFAKYKQDDAHVARFLLNKVS